ncbi:hypothetical protein ACP275_04G190100 [Erythranthe tilingii]
MGSFSGLVIGLSFVFGCILMGLFLELYYLLWWKKKMAAHNSNSNSNSSRSTSEIEEGFSLFFCWNWKKPNSSSNPQLGQDQDLEMGPTKELGLLKSYGEEGIESELMRVHNLSGPPRFLFTIKEEDFESDADAKSRSSRKGSRTKSLGDVFGADVTPMSSPSFADSYRSGSSNHGFNDNPLFESMSEAEVNRLRSSPPPKFKFLKDAEDKLIRRLLVEEAMRKSGFDNGGSVVRDSAVNEPRSSCIEEKR